MKHLILFAVLAFLSFEMATGQVICILCYDQNNSISPGANNLLLNGSFENNNCVPNQNSSTFCPNSIDYSCDIANWTCTGGGPYTYASVWDNTYALIADGDYAVYLGNSFCTPCSAAFNDTSCLINLDCSVTGLPVGFPQNALNYGGAAGISLEQTVSGLIVGDTYILEFLAGGETILNSFPNRGLFAVDVGFGDTLLRCKSTGSGDTGTCFIIEFKATSSSHTIKFTNWGHISDLSTEVILDNVKLYTLAELAIPSCGGPITSNAFMASDSAVCEKFCISFTDLSTNNPISWQWHFPGGNPGSSINQNPSNICYATPGTFDVTLITINAGGTDTLTLTNYITVNATPPFPIITQDGYTLSTTSGASYQWQLNTVEIPGATNQSFTVLQSGLYTVQVSDMNGCMNSANKYVLITGIEEVSGGGTISIYPNPSLGSFMVEITHLTTLTNAEVSIDVANTLGQIIFSSTQQIASYPFKKEIDLNDVANGIYFIEIKMQNDFARKKILIAE